MKIINNIFFRIASLENLFSAWKKFVKDKQKKTDVQRFEFKLEQNLFQLHRELMSKRYQHGPYTDFYIRDPKVRHIHKALVRDRVLHHAVFQVLNPFYESTFIPNSFSCRIGKGTHKGVLALETMARKVSRNYTRPCFALKCDVRKFFDSVDHGVLLTILGRKVIDPNTMWLLRGIVGSYSSVPGGG